MDHKFTQRLKDWLDTKPELRNYADGALYILKLSGNQILYKNLVTNPYARRDFIEHEIQKYYNFRVQDLTHAQVVEMEKKVEEIVAEHIPLAAKADERQKGKRPDHDSLPDEIKAMYVENLSLLRRMRELHMKLRSLSTVDSPCPDSERYPFLKELIALDKKLHSNWEAYDYYVVKPKRNSRKNETGQES